LLLRSMLRRWLLRPSLLLVPPAVVRVLLPADLL
jgi:hypothetical protein